MKGGLMSILVIALALLPATLRAQVVSDLTDGKLHTQRAGTQVDIFRFSGAVGTRALLEVKADGPFVATVYTPDGAEMVTQEATGRAALEAYLPSSSAYVVSVARASKATAYTVQLFADPPDLVDAYLAQGVGYELVIGGSREYRCWVSPGRKIKVIGANATVTRKRTGVAAAAADGDYISTAGVSVPYRITLALDGDDLVATRQFDHGEARNTVDLDWSPLTGAPGAVRWRGYSCPDSE